MSGAAALLSAAYLTVAGRMLGPVEYGSLGTLLALTGLVSLALAPLETSVAKLVAEYHSEQAPGRMLSLLRGSIRRSGLWFIGIAALSLPLFPYTSRSLKLGGTLELGVFVAYVGAWLLMSCARGVLRGDHRFTEVGVTLLVESAGRLALGLLFMVLARSAAAGIGGYFVGMTLSVLCAAWQLRDLRRHAPLPVDLGRLAALSGNTFFLFLYFQFVMSFDMVVAKRALEPSASGFYAACSTIAKLIIVGAGPLLNVLFTRVSSMHAAQQPVAKLVWRAVWGSALLLLLSLIVPWLGGDLLLRVLFGEAFRGDSTTIRILWLTASVLVPQQVLGLSLVAANRARGAWTLALPCVLLAVLLHYFAASSVQVATCGLVAALSGSLSLGFMAWSSARALARA
jgi:O-antigen/teichoic acid export membrane protein